MEWFFSPSQSTFYYGGLIDEYMAKASWPDDAIPVPNDVREAFAGVPPEGKTLGTIEDMPAWVDVPPLSKDELIKQADAKKSALLTAANDFINGNQWPSKLMLGRLSDVDKKRFNDWLDYTDELQALDTSKAPLKNWPVQPEI